MQTRFFPACLTSLEGLREYVLTAAGKAELSSEQTYRLELAVDELATNTINYGLQGRSIHDDTKNFISIKAKFDHPALVIILKDPGIAFNPLNRKLPDQEDLHRSLEVRDIGGLGIYLAVTGVDRFEYKRQNGLNINILTVISDQPSADNHPR